MTPATTTTLAVIEYPGGATYVTGRIDQFQIDGGTVETDADGVQHVLTRWWRGSGDYEGLTFYMWIAGSDVGSPFFDWAGIIVPGDPPPGA